MAGPIHCPRCLTRCAREHLFCGGCGAALPPRGDALSASRPRRWTWVLASFTVVGAGVAIAWWQVSPPPPVRSSTSAGRGPETALPADRAVRPAPSAGPPAVAVAGQESRQGREPEPPPPRPGPVEVSRPGRPVTRDFAAAREAVIAASEAALHGLGWVIDRRRSDRALGTLATHPRDVGSVDLGVYREGTRHRLRLNVGSSRSGRVPVRVSRELWVEARRDVAPRDTTVERGVLDAIRSRLIRPPAGTLTPGSREHSQSGMTVSPDGRDPTGPGTPTTGG